MSPHQLDIMYWLFGKPLRFRGNSLNQSKLYSAPDVATLEAVYPHHILLSGVWAFNVGEAASSDLL